MGDLIADELGAYVAGIGYGDLGATTVKETKKRIVDAIGCALGAFNETPVTIARRAVTANTPGGRSTILGTTTKTSPDMATFVNGLMIRYFDFNDTYLSKEPAHPSDNIGATLSVAESVGASGRDLILATALAYEVQCRLCDSADLRHRGWDHVCYGLVSAALGAGKLMKLDAGRLSQAVNISLNAHLAMRQVRAGELSMWKGASFSNAARNAVFAAQLAESGMTGPSPVFEGEMGFFKQVSGPFSLDTGRFGARGRGFKVAETYIKYFPAEYHAQTAVRAAIDLSRILGDPDDIETVEVMTHEAGYSILGSEKEKWRPTTKETADHSLPFMVAVSLLKGGLGNSSYSARTLRDKRVVQLMKRVTVAEDPRLTALYPKRGMPNRLTVRMRSGKTLSKQVVVPRGHPLNPMSDVEVEQKFRGLVAATGQKGLAEGVLRSLRRLEEVSDVGALLPKMVIDR